MEKWYILRVLIACEFSGIIRDAFIEQGHDAWSCDLLPSESNNGPHYQDSIHHVLTKTMYDWDMMIAHPPCTYLANSGVSWLYKQEGRWAKLREGALFFKQLLEADIPKICIENPIMHKYAVEIIGRRQDQVIQPWQFGHGETKATCLWLKNLPKLEPTNIVNGREQRLHRLPPSLGRAKERSRTFKGIAKAMAKQWSDIY